MIMVMIIVLSFIMIIIKLNFIIIINLIYYKVFKFDFIDYSTL